MAFCNSLRRRPSCSSLIPVLLSTSPILSLREDSLKTHDLAIPFASPASNNRQLRLIILTPSSSAPENQESTLSRLQHFESLTGGADSAILFLLFPDPKSAPSNDAQNSPYLSSLHTFTQTQLVVLNHSLNIPLLPLSTPSSLQKIISTFITSLTASTSALSTAKTPNAAMDILPYSTVNGKMMQDTHIAMTDMFTCMRDVAGLGVGGEAVRELVRRGLGEEEAEGAVQFWAEEWVCE